MPRGDRTGPQGMGPQTGRAAGFCAGYDVPGYANPGPGRGYGMGRGGAWGRGGGRGWRHWFHATGLPRWARFGGPQGAPQMTGEQEADVLKAQATWLGQQLEEIQRRLTELEK
jgi:hypothetical protein